MQAAPIVRVAVEAALPSELPRLVEGLRLLNRADPFLEVTLQDKGEYVLGAAGMHTPPCLPCITRGSVSLTLQVCIHHPTCPARQRGVGTGHCNVSMILVQPLLPRCNLCFAGMAAGVSVGSNIVSGCKVCDTMLHGKTICHCDDVFVTRGIIQIRYCYCEKDAQDCIHSLQNSLSSPDLLCVQSRFFSSCSRHHVKLLVLSVHPPSKHNRLFCFDNPPSPLSPPIPFSPVISSCLSELFSWPTHTQAF